MKKLAIISILLASFFILIPEISADLNDGLVSRYPLDGNANDAIGSNHGIENGGLSYLPGILGQAADFDGIDDHILVPSNPSLQLNTFTITAWVRPDSIIWGNRIVEKGNSNSYYLDINYNAKALVGFFDGNYHDLTSIERIIPGSWYFIAGSYDGTVLQIYIDGVLDNELPIESQPFQNDEPLLIGWKYNGIPEDRFDGLIDEVYLYNRALSEAEIQELYGFEPKNQFIDIGDIGNTKFWMEEEEDYFYLTGGWVWLKSDGTLIDNDGDTGVYRLISELTIEMIWDYVSYDDATLTFPKSSIEVGDRVEVIFKSMPSSVFYFIVTAFSKMPSSNGGGAGGDGGGGGGGGG